MSTKAIFHTQIIIYFQIAIIFILAYLGYVLIKAFLNKREGAFYFILSFFIGYLTIVNDILYHNEVIFTGNFAPLGLYIFTFSQAFLLSHRFSRAFSTIEQFSITFQKFVPIQFLNRVAKEGIETIKLGNVENDYITILFSDIRSFTTISETMTPEEVFNFLNSYLSRMEPPIQKYNGFVDKYIGDAIMALFDFGSDEEEAESAVNAAIEMQEALKIYNGHRFNSGYQPIKTGIGIHSGNVMIGTLGSSERMESTAIGDSVNLASRIEGMTKLYKVSILISDHTYFQLKTPIQYSVRFIDRVIAVGKSIPITLYEVFDADPPDLKEKKFKTKIQFEKGLDLYTKREFRQAIPLFEGVLKINPDDYVATIYIDRCEKNLMNGVDQDWNGITSLDTK